MMLPKKWNFKSSHPELIKQIAAGLQVSLPTAKVLANRGITCLSEAEQFLSPEKGALYNPFLLPGMDKAAERIRKALDTGEKILVYGDRDVDGITSICIMVRTLKSLGADPLWYIPSDEGYGVHNEVIERYSKLGVTLIVTVDCGISAAENVTYAKGLGIDVVVTDHHEPAQSGLPDAVAVVDPKLSCSKYPFTSLAGCAVSFKTCEALMQSFGKYFNKDLLFMSVETVSGGTRIFAVKAKNGIETGRIELNMPRTGNVSKQALEEFFSFAKDSVIITQKSESTIDLLNQAFKKNGLETLPCSLIDMDDYVRRQSSGSTETIPESAKESSKLSLEEQAIHIMNEFESLEKANDLRMSFFRENNMDVVALGTIADIMPLVSENRVFVKLGLKQLENTRKKGLKALVEKCSKNSKAGELSAKFVSWSITPVLNAAGRRGKAGLSCELLLTDDSRQADKLIVDILQLNSERKELQAENLEKFIPMLKEQCDLENDKIFIVTASGIEHGVTGIIASQIMRQYRRPTVLLIIEDGQAMGAARSFEGYDILSAIAKLEDILIKYGGHSQAAGLTVSADKIDEFKSRLKAIAQEEILPEMLVQSVDIDADIDAHDVSAELINELSRLEPFGMGNPRPIFALKNMKIKELTRMGANNAHVRLKVSKNGSVPLTAVGWGLGFIEEEILPSELIDLAVQLEFNVWQDKSNVQLLIEDIKPSEG